MNRLQFADNLRWLSDPKEFPDATIDLVYLALPEHLLALELEFTTARYNCGDR
jgi:hypothetical protein